MNATLFQLVVLLNAALLALPPGWCCRLLPHPQAEHVAESPSCCEHAQAPSSPTNEKETPPAPSDKCCCSRIATVAEKPVAPPDVPARDFVVSANVELTVSPAAHDARPAIIAWPSGPRLHVLQCVWRC